MKIPFTRIYILCNILPKGYRYIGYHRDYYDGDYYNFGFWFWHFYIYV